MSKRGVKQAATIRKNVSQPNIQIIAKATNEIHA
jgi:hypothetical protein